MIKKSFILTSSGLKNLVQNQNYGEDFKFIFGEHEIQMKNLHAEFVSPYVSRIHQSDPTIKSIHLCKEHSTKQCKNNALSQISDEVFTLFDSISKGEMIEIDEKQCFQLQIISILLQNYEMFTKLDELFDKENDIAKETIDKKFNEELEFISLLDTNSESADLWNRSKMIEYIASHLYSIDSNQIIDLPITVFYSILKHDKLTIDSEDSLFDLIDEFFNKEKEQKSDFTSNNNLSEIDFYETVNFDFLSEEKFKEFIEKLDPNEMTTSLWNKIKKCFYVYKEKSPKSSTELIQRYGNGFYRHVQQGRLIKYDGQKEHAFTGIIHELTNEAGGNVDDKGYVKVTSSSIIDSYHIPKLAVDLNDSKSYFESNGEKNSWLQYDFMKRKVCPTQYSIRSRPDNGKGGYHPKNWAIEGSNDNENGNGNWTTLDSRENVDSLNESSAVQTFDIKNTEDAKNGFRFLRIRYTGPNISGSDYMVISALEYFGQLIDKKD